MMLKAYLHDSSGATAIEYGLIAALLALGLIGGFTALGGGMRTIYEKIHTSIA